MVFSVLTIYVATPIPTCALLTIPHCSNYCVVCCSKCYFAVYILRYVLYMYIHVPIHCVYTRAHHSVHITLCDGTSSLFLSFLSIIISYSELLF